MRKTCLAVATFGLASISAFLGTAGRLDAAGLTCSLFIDHASGAVLQRRGECATRVTPMSTFKVPLALMGFDAGILTGPDKPVWKYKTEFNAPKRARKPVDPTVWERESILWYSQELTRKLGRAEFERYVTAFGYGNADVSDVPDGRDPLTHAWLSASLEISADEQASFLRRMLDGKLPVSDDARMLTLDVMPVFASDGWTIRGKTGSGWRRGKDGKADRSRPVGWFVGWAERGGRTIVFAQLSVGETRAREPQGPVLRDAFLRDWPTVSKSF